MDRIIRVGSRESRLAVAQTNLVLDQIKKFHPEITFELVTMKTTGDKILDRDLDQVGGKGLFVKELDRALLEGRVDMTIHSLKDLPMELTPGLPVLGYSRREDPRDVLILRRGLREVGEGQIGTSSKRRALQLKRLYPEASFRSIRGNVRTRLRKLEEEGYAATVLARAGLVRLGMEEIITRTFSTEEVIPAAGQGILVFQGREGEAYDFLSEVSDQASAFAALAERSFVRTLNGGCSSPAAAYAEIEGDSLLLSGLYYDEATGGYTTGRARGKVREAEKLGEELALSLKESYKREEAHV